MKILRELINAYFYEKLHLRCFTGFQMPLCFGNLSSLSLNRMPTVQIITPKLLQKVRGSIKRKGIIYCCEQLHLRFRAPRFVSAERHSRKIALAFTTKRPERPPQ